MAKLSSSKCGLIYWKSNQSLKFIVSLKKAATTCIAMSLGKP